MAGVVLRERMCLGLLVLIAAGSAFAAADGGCLACHGDVEGTHGHPLAPEPGAPGCRDCHADAEDHAAAPTDPAAGQAMLSFAGEAAERRAGVCLECHRSAHPPGGDVHLRAGVACDDCHEAHGDDPLGLSATTLPAGFEDVDAASAVCADCHAAAFASFAMNERHRLAEGAISCVSCHDPHASRSDSLLGHPSEAACGDCHDEMTGPFVFEHAASRVDGCLSCHEPHGSPNRHLLTHQQEGALCYSCHVMVPQFHVGFGAGPPRFDENTVCTNCHTMIHGSNFDRDFLR